MKNPYPAFDEPVYVKDNYDIVAIHRVLRAEPDRERGANQWLVEAATSGAEETDSDALALMQAKQLGAIIPLMALWRDALWKCEGAWAGHVAGRQGYRLTWFSDLGPEPAA